MRAAHFRYPVNSAAWLVLVLPALMIAEPADAQRRDVQAGADRATQRIQFRYPDQPVTAETPQPARTSPAPSAQASGQGRNVVQSASLGPVPSSVETPASRELGAAAPARAGEFHQTGLGIVYGDEFAGLPTANGELFSQASMTAAHPSLPLPSLVRVTNRQNGKEVVVRVNDRGPFEDGAALQVSRRVADTLAFGQEGRAMLEITYLGPAPAVPAASAPAPSTQTVAAAAPLPEPQTELLGGDDNFSRPVPPPRQIVRPPASPDTGEHFVQVASFSELGNAEALYRSLAGSWSVEIVPARVHGADFFRVRIGPFSDRDTAERHRDRLHREGRAEGRVVTSQYY